jgi:hypothetical protein
MSDFPNSIDNFTDEVDAVDYPQASDMNGVYDALEKVEAKVGIDGSAVSTSLDYKLKNTTSGHNHDGSNSKKVLATSLDPTGVTVSQLLRANSAGTAVEGSGYTIGSLLSAMTTASQASWPIGSVFIGAVATNPATLLGFGTWARLGEGQMLVGYKVGDADFGTLKGTGGSKTSSALIAHTHTGPSHTHIGTTGNVSADHVHSGTTGGESGHVHVPASGVQYMETIASGGTIDRSTGTKGVTPGTTGASTGHTHGFTTGGISANHTHSFTTGAAGTGDTGSAGSGSSFSIINPFAVVCAWERTA